MQLNRIFAARILIVLALVLACPEAAHARTSDEEDARRLFAQGNRLRKRGDHEGALIKFRAAYRLLPSFKIDLNIAFTLYDLRRHAGAAEAFARFLRKGARKSPPRIVKLARARLRKLRRLVASVRVDCTVAGAMVTINGRRRGATPLPAEVYVAPGTHRLQVAREGYVPISLTLELSAGEHVERAVELQLEPRPQAPRAAVEAPAEDPILVQQHRRKSTIGYIFLGTGLALAAAGGFAIGLGVSSGSDAHDAYNAESSKANGNSAVIAGHREDVESARALVITGDVLLGVGLVAIGVSIYQLVTRPKLRELGTPSVSVAPTRGGAALIVGGCF